MPKELPLQYDVNDDVLLAKLSEPGLKGPLPLFSPVPPCSVCVLSHKALSVCAQWWNCIRRGVGHASA